MRYVFADTAFFLALFERTSRAHADAVAAARDADQALVLTSAIVLELGAALSLEPDRPLFLKLVDGLKNTPQHRLIEVDAELLRRSIELFRARADKNWSLADCTSILVMQDLGLTDVLTTDRHFAQAGFKVRLPLAGEDG